jgi:hypothetical protein
LRPERGVLRADTDLATLLGNLAEFRDAGYVDQMARLAQAQLENR